MIKNLPLDFSMEKYGLKVRLATEADTDFILSLRSDKELTKFIHQTVLQSSLQIHLIPLFNYLFYFIDMIISNLKFQEDYLFVSNIRLLSLQNSNQFLILQFDLHLSVYVISKHVYFLYVHQIQ